MSLAKIPQAAVDLHHACHHLSQLFKEFAYWAHVSNWTIMLLFFTTPYKITNLNFNTVV